MPKKGDKIEVSVKGKWVLATVTKIEGENLFCIDRTLRHTKHVLSVTGPGWHEAEQKPNWHAAKVWSDSAESGPRMSKRFEPSEEQKLASEARDKEFAELVRMRAEKEAVVAAKEADELVERFVSLEMEEQLKQARKLIKGLRKAEKKMKPFREARKARMAKLRKERIWVERILRENRANGRKGRTIELDETKKAVILNKISGEIFEVIGPRAVTISPREKLICVTNAREKAVAVEADKNLQREAKQELAKLVELSEAGFLVEEEFEERRKELLAKCGESGTRTLAKEAKEEQERKIAEEEAKKQEIEATAKKEEVIKKQMKKREHSKKRAKKKKLALKLLREERREIRRIDFEKWLRMPVYVRRETKKDSSAFGDSVQDSFTAAFESRGPGWW